MQRSNYINSRYKNRQACVNSVEPDQTEQNHSFINDSNWEACKRLSQLIIDLMQQYYLMPHYDLGETGMGKQCQSQTRRNKVILL